MKHYSLVVVGAGHAGLEAAWMAHQFKIRTAVVTLPKVGIASAPCNPAIGGVGKGQVVREIDALGGLMGKLADLAGIQYRTLNDSKGYAVRSTRVQIDKDLYSQHAKKILSSSEYIEIIRDSVVLLGQEKNSFILNLKSAAPIGADKIIITTGTFLNGLMHTGSEMTEGGRFRNDRSPGLCELISNIRNTSRRFKTGTPPRILKNTINIDNMVEQKSDDATSNFHWEFQDDFRKAPQVSCYIAHTNEKTLESIRDNKNSSPLFNGQIKGVGPRYCPSIEDKAVRYPDKNIHHIFIEPEGLNLDTVYPNGVSTSLPKEVQDQFIRSIVGLENAEISIYGYAVEYDVVDTLLLSQSLEYKEIPGLYFAGQVNGTSGYEEAAAQGLVAGLNASLSVLGRNEIIFERENSYIGVMINDLVSSSRDEPYRLFTARAENRLFLREDNVFERMWGYRKQFELNNKLDLFYVELLKEIDILQKLAEISFKANSKLELSLRDPKQDPVKLLNTVLDEFGLKFTTYSIKAVAISIKYGGYIKKADEVNYKVRRLEKMKIDWNDLIQSKNISFECKERIKKYKPQTFAQLKQIEGIRPATLSIIAGRIY